MSNFYVAIHKETGDILRGAKGQVVMESEQSLARSIGQNESVKYEAQQKGAKPRELYTIKEIDLLSLIKPSNLAPLEITEFTEDGGDWRADYVSVTASIGDETIFNDGIGDLSECPEDANTDRDLCFIYDIVPALKRAHKAGLEGRPIIVKYENSEEDE